MATIPLILDLGLERGKCYTVSGTVSGLTGNLTITVGNDVDTFTVANSVTNGAFSADFEYTTESTFFKTLYLTASDDDYVIDDFALKLDETCQQEYCSECFSLTDCDYPCEYQELSWTNTKDAFGFNYTALPLKQTLTIKGGLRNQDYPYEEEYFTTSGGDYFPVYVDATKTEELWVHEVPAYIHDALRIGLVHDDFRINNVRYAKVEGSYSPDWDTPNSLLAPVIVKVREKIQDTKNRNCG